MPVSTYLGDGHGRDGADIDVDEGGEAELHAGRVCRRGGKEVMAKEGISEWSTEREGEDGKEKEKKMAKVKRYQKGKKGKCIKVFVKSGGKSEKRTAHAWV